jgi:NAD+ diphosphatase
MFFPFQARLADLSRLNAFAGNRLDRGADRRDETCLDEALAAPGARLYLFAGGRVLLERRSSAAGAAFDRAGAARIGWRSESLILLGHAADGPRLAALIDEAAELAAPLEALDLRSLAIEGSVSPEDLGALAQARALLHWNATHRFCGSCGAPTTMRAGGQRRQCPSCGAQAFPRVDPVVIMLTIRGDECLLGHHRRFAARRYSALAGYVEPGETIEDAVRREVKEEAGIDVGRVAYHSSQPWPFASSLMIGCHCEALSAEISPDEEELKDCRWFSRDEVALMLANRHPEGLTAPPPIAIAHRLLQAFASPVGDS